MKIPIAFNFFYTTTYTEILRIGSYRPSHIWESPVTGQITCHSDTRGYGGNRRSRRIGKVPPSIWVSSQTCTHHKNIIPPGEGTNQTFPVRKAPVAC